MKRGAFSVALAAFGLLAAAFLTSCGGGSVEFYPLKSGGSTEFGAPKNPSEVQIFITKKPDFPYEELGVIIYETSPSMSDEPAAYDILRQKAAEMGADGIIIMNSQMSLEQRPGAIVLDYSYVPIQTDTTVTRIKYRAMAIKRK